MRRSSFEPFFFRVRSMGARSARVGSDAPGFRERGQILLVAVAAVAPDDALQRCIRFERGGIDADRLPLDQAGRAQHPREDEAMYFEIDQPLRARNRGGPAGRAAARLSSEGTPVSRSATTDGPMCKSAHSTERVRSTGGAERESRAAGLKASTGRIGGAEAGRRRRRISNRPATAPEVKSFGRDFGEAQVVKAD